MRGERNGEDITPDILAPALCAGGDIPGAESIVRTPTDERPVILEGYPPDTARVSRQSIGVDVLLCVGSRHCHRRHQHQR